MKEFQLIEHFFNKKTCARRDVLQGIGDDCALVQAAPNKNIAISVDTLVENVHFLTSMPACDLGYKSLAVNLSDLAAMGAVPSWMTLALTMPEVDENWLTGFCEGLFEAADYYNIALVGGDTTRGPKAISITVLGQLPEHKTLTRSGAKVGDWLYVTGTLGDSALGLALLQQKLDATTENKNYLIQRHYRPTPRVLAGQSILGLASSCIDLSDGLNSDINHIINASNVGFKIDVENLPLSTALLNTVSLETGLGYALSGGEDYELMFTVAETHRGAVETSLKHNGVPFTRIGQAVANNKLILQQNGNDYLPADYGFQHF